MTSKLSCTSLSTVHIAAELRNALVTNFTLTYSTKAAAITTTTNRNYNQEQSTRFFTSGAATLKQKHLKVPINVPKESIVMAANGLLDPNGNYPRRDYLTSLEGPAQKLWADQKIFEADAANDGRETYMVTFPYPYMNGRLHLGHVFTLSKIEFAANYQRLQGKNVLFPFGFHCTGMPIKAAADKIKYEMEEFGCPPDFSAEEEKVDSTDMKSKIAAKTGGLKRQWNILKSLGLKDDEIAPFADSAYWLKYFPPKTMQDLKAIGLSADWRRSFITTPANPYYDSFVRWQMTTLKERGYVDFGKRNTIYSPKDEQPCMDHDRSSGEGVGYTEYTVIKLKVLELPKTLKELKVTSSVYFVAATLRPETMYGQTNCYVHPELDYGVYEANKNELFICTPYCARNMKYQLADLPGGFGNIKQLATVKGQELLGVPLSAPLCQFERIYTFPMMTIIATMGTGIVCSVPSDSPDDYVNFISLKKKPEWRAKFGITDEMIMPYDPVPIINTPELGDISAEKCVHDMKISGPNDKAKLEEAKKLCYYKGFHHGTMIIGEYKGKSVIEAKEAIKKQLLASGQAVLYAEPAGKVVSRSGDECVVALVDQWYIDYGNTEWKARVQKLLEKMEAYEDDVKLQFKSQIENLHEWACSRSFGLGTLIPWDERFLVESLSDSTIYMAYYTVAHLLHGGSLDGKDGTSPLNITPEQMNMAAWNYIFLGVEPESECTIPRASLDKMRAEFEYWYPLNVRVSGKDLINNHLTFFLFTHEAIWGDKYFPKAIKCNGHLKLNNAKMSKSDGNFITLIESVKSFGADPTRFALADAGDSTEDANVDYGVLSKIILKLYTLKDLMEESASKVTAGSYRRGELNYYDIIVLNNMKLHVKSSAKQYENLAFHAMMKYAFHHHTSLYSFYKDVTSDEGMGMHEEVVKTYLHTQTLMLAPITPHLCEKLWEIIGFGGSILKEGRWSSMKDDHDSELQAILDHSNRVLTDVRMKFIAKTDPKKQPKPKKGQAPQPLKIPTGCIIYVAKSYRASSKKLLDFLDNLYHNDKALFQDKKYISTFIMNDAELKDQSKRLMPFVANLQAEVISSGDASLLSTKIKFDEFEHLGRMTNFFARSMQFKKVEIQWAHECEDANAVSNVDPMNPAVSFTFDD